MISKHIAFGLSLVLAGSSPSLATDWNGFYAGVFGGYTNGHVDAETTTGTFPSSIGHSGGLIGVNVGSNYVVDDYFIGVEGDIFTGSVTGSASCASDASKQCGSIMEWGGTIRARAGVVMDDWLVFGTGGIAFGRGRSTVSTAGVVTASDSQDFIGWTVGLGAEYAISEDVSIRGEYSYTDWGTRTSAPGSLSATDQYIGHPVFHTLKVGVNVGF